jgi:urease accessory protein
MPVGTTDRSHVTSAVSAAKALPPGVLAMALADARLPSGGHAHSAGVEPALAAGLAPQLVPELMAVRARTTVAVDAGAAVVARHLIDSGRPDRLPEVEAAWAARTPAPSVRAASRVLGRGHLRLGAGLWPDHPVWAELRGWPRPPSRAVVLGAFAAAAGTAPDELVRAVIYDDAACGAAALLKLEPGDPVRATAWVLAVCTAAEPQVAALAAITDPADVPAAAAPQAEGWAQAHARLNRRLFRA